MLLVVDLLVIASPASSVHLATAIVLVVPVMLLSASIILVLVPLVSRIAVVVLRVMHSTVSMRIVVIIIAVILPSLATSPRGTASTASAVSTIPAVL